MILYVNGDSNSIGVSGGFWVAKIQQHFQAKLINQSAGGGSNPRIIRTARDFFSAADNNFQDFFVIIGWTSWEREEWPYQGDFIQVNASGRNVVPQPLRERYLKWVNDADCISQIEKSRIAHNDIYNFHLSLTSLQIPHLFFNALMPFQHEVLSQPMFQYDWHGNYFGPYDNDSSYFWFLKNRGFEPDEHNHHQQEAQELWADVMINYIVHTALLK